MRTCYLLLAVVTTVFASTKATLFATADSKQYKIAGAISSFDTSPSTLSPTVRDNNGVGNRALRGNDVSNLDSLDVEDERAHEDDEERALTLSKMKKMRKKKMTKEDYAAKLGISEQIASILAGGPGLTQFLQTHKYQKYKTYMNYLIEAKKKKGK
ncbi:hypothetical protein PHYBOEH_008876 [Phytophthora boehmeriae]|uniref:PexRD2 WYL domain-containing protein n=1 Tax=Phytophthora boehmeriae TaxID=109152 RepID=A0A8T1W1M3_9STRA|nr:hypothetical protein PHYBOEH_008876 [Phytophthora boehmeriae]